jgi:hypothetical protein
MATKYKRPQEPAARTTDRFARHVEAFDRLLPLPPAAHFQDVQVASLKACLLCGNAHSQASFI